MELSNPAIHLRDNIDAAFQESLKKQIAGDITAEPYDDPYVVMVNFLNENYTLLNEIPYYKDFFACEYKPGYVALVYGINHVRVTHYTKLPDGKWIYLTEIPNVGNPGSLELEIRNYNDIYDKYDKMRNFLNSSPFGVEHLNQIKNQFNYNFFACQRQQDPNSELPVVALVLDNENVLFFTKEDHYDQSWAY